MVYPRECPRCGTLTPEDGFGVDRHQPSGRKSRCRVCHRRDVKAYDDAVRKPRRLAALEAERAAEWKALEAEHRERAKAVKRAAAAGAKRQREFLASIGVEDVSGGSFLGASGRPAGTTSALGLRKGDHWLTEKRRPRCLPTCSSSRAGTIPALDLTRVQAASRCSD
jgi:hypothetical protein